MRARLANSWNNIIHGLWFIPSVITAASIALSAFLLYIDSAFLQDSGTTVFWLFGGSASAARTMLSTIAGSLITVISIAFSITIIALQQASSQFTPRILRNFTGDRANQVVLGVYIATFTYALLVMRQVRDPSTDGGAFVPALSISMAILLALTSLGMLIYFIHHISMALQVSMILISIRADVEAQLAKVFPGPYHPGSPSPAALHELVGQTERDRRGVKTVIHAPNAGYLRHIDENRLFEIAGADVHLVWVTARTGSFLQKGSTMVSIWAEDSLPEDQQAYLEGAFILGRQRTMQEDPLFGIRQIVDIAVKALSPGINDPTTAEQCLDALGDILARVVGLTFPPLLRREEGGTLYLFDRANYLDYVEASFSQIRRANSMVHVTVYLFETLIQLSQHVPSEERAAPLRAQVHQVLAGLESSKFSDADRELIRYQGGAVLDALTLLPGRKERAVA